MTNIIRTQPIHRRITGVVVSDKMMKTAVVEVTRRVWHKKYQKQYIVTHRLKAHNEDNVCHIGDTVMIEETRPLSKEKRWRIIKRIKEKVRPTEG